MKFHIIESGKFKLDGGAMFGVVPKSMWQRLNEPDENNLCTWNMRCLLIEHEDKLILIDAGLGYKQSEKFFSHFKPHGPYSLKQSINEVGFTFDDITDVLITHLHFDHVGGALMHNENGQIVPTFPKAKYWSNKKHFDWAFSPNPREKASFLKENFVPLADLGLLHFIPEDKEFRWLDRFEFFIANGHTRSMMVPIIHADHGQRIIYCADLLPSIHHVRMPYVMSYDVDPLQTLKEKQIFYNKILEIPETYLFFEHDPENVMGKLRISDKGRYSIELEKPEILANF